MADPTPNTTEHDAFVEAIREFVKAADRVQATWNEQSIDATEPYAYPKYLPSFDEFVDDLHAMSEAIEPR